jgi:hypothetical protein
MPPLVETFTTPTPFGPGAPPGSAVATKKTGASSINARCSSVIAPK